MYNLKGKTCIATFFFSSINGNRAVSTGQLMLIQEEGGDP
jgi:hypothetical protein